MGASEVTKRAEQGRHAALETPRRTDARLVPHQQAQIQRPGVYQYPLEDIGVTPQMHAPHPAPFRRDAQTDVPAVRRVGATAVARRAPRMRRRLR